MIEQVLVNLIRNGMDAMRDISLELRRLTISVGGATTASRSPSGDRGRGIAPETAERLFEPFFTTKTEGMGMGPTSAARSSNRTAERCASRPRPTVVQFSDSGYRQANHERSTGAHCR